MIRKIPVSRPYHGLIRYDAIFRFWDRAFDLISDALPFGRLWYGEPNATDFVIKKLPPPTPTV